MKLLITPIVLIVLGAIYVAVVNRRGKELEQERKDFVKQNPQLFHKEKPKCKCGCSK